MYKGPDPGFPWLSERERFTFPLPENAKDNSVVAVGGNLSPGMLLSAYEQGLFPWYNEGDPLLWHSPDPRFVIFPDCLHVSVSMKKVLNRREFTITFDRDFEGVVRSCSEVFRPGQGGTWITDDIIKAYTILHRLGWAHSAEAWSEGGLIGGCYGIRIGNVFFGESMFAKKPNASKAAFISLARLLFDDEAAFIDCQIPTDHLRSLGGMEISRMDFLKMLRKTLLLRRPCTAEADLLDRRGELFIRRLSGGGL
ncbi:MAG: leucyl/phenylalanyl-tRNA--protein transferase [Treponema sp.]|jgi:leucyl/phenylalanyl-tRNA--protein transferase|nr:leucyl/phenylalanyl-tRNA--protein transferase [Treponema sp.]